MSVSVYYRSTQNHVKLFEHPIHFSVLLIFHDIFLLKRFEAFIAVFPVWNAILVLIITYIYEAFNTPSKGILKIMQ